MTITDIPAEYSSAFGDLVYTLSGTGSGDITEVEIRGGVMDPVLGIKLLRDEGKIKVNAAPYIRRMLDPVPVTAGGIGFHSGHGRTVTGSIAVNGIAAPQRTFTAAVCGLRQGSVMSEMPVRREIGPGERDEISFITEGGICSAFIEVYASSYVPVPVEEYLSDKGVCIFSLPADCVVQYLESLHIDPATCEMIGLTIFRGEEPVFNCIYRFRPKGKGVRVCWLNGMGGMDYFTFPIRVSRRRRGCRQRIYSEAGYRTVASTAENQTELNSGYLPEAVLEGLVGLVNSPRVWRSEGENMIAVDVLDEDVLTLSGEPYCIKLKIRDCRTVKYQEF